MNCYGRLVLLVLAACMPGTTAPLHAQPSSTTASIVDSNANTQPKTPTTSAVKLSQAERIIRLEQVIEAGIKELASLKTSLANPESEYAKAKADFTRLDSRLKERQKELASQPAPGDGKDPLEGLKKARELAKERFDLALKDLGATREKCAGLENKLKLDQDVLSKLRGIGSSTSQPVAADSPSAGTAQASKTQTTVPTSPTREASKSESTADATTATVPPNPQTVKLPGLPQLGPQATGETRSAVTTTSSPDADNKELIEAQAKAHSTKTDAATAEQELNLIEARIAALRQAIKTETQLRDNAKQRATNANAIYDGRRDRIQKLIAEGASTEELNKFWSRVDEAEKLAEQSETEVNKHVTAIDELNAQMDELRNEQDDVRSRHEQIQAIAREAQSQVRRLENPFSVYNIKQWLLNHGPKILGILLGMASLMWFTGVAETRITKLIARGDGQGTQRERESRAQTLASVFRNFGSTVIICGGILMLLSEIRVDIVPLLGGAAVFGLAVAFGAQSLIKDYFYGFMILLENQYAIDDVIKIGDTTGSVERITLRMTVLRSADGSAHFIPHGEVHKVTNMSHRWSRAVFDISVSYRENVDDVMKVLMEIGQQLRREPVYDQQILDGPEMLGVDAFGDSAVVIKFHIKTRPLQQWIVKREMLRRIKKRFDELGIEIPYPHQVVYNRPDGGPVPEEKGSKS